MQADLFFGTFNDTTLDENNFSAINARTLDWIFANNICETPPPPESPLTIKAYKVVCNVEPALPNWGLVGAEGRPLIITAATAADFIAASNGRCDLGSDWSFQYGFDAKSGTPGVDELVGSHIGQADGTPSTGMCSLHCGTNTATGTGYSNWKNFASATTATSPATVEIANLEGGPGIWVRENLKPGYIPFSFPGDPDPGSAVSAEMYCHNNISKYNNYDEITNPVLGNTYYCVAFNAPKKPTLKVTKVVVNDNDGTSVVADFSLNVNATSVMSGVANVFDPGAYVITENGPAGYTSAFSGDCDATGHITIAAGHEYVCTLTNNDIAPVGGSGGGGTTGGGGGGGGAAAPTGSISGAKFNDLNGNGLRDAGEPGLAGWTIYLDLNNNSALDASEPFQTTDVNGNYSFAGINTGSYFVREVAQSSWTQTLPGAIAGFTYFVPVTANATVSGMNFGNLQGQVLGIVRPPDVGGGEIVELPRTGQSWELFAVLLLIASVMLAGIKPKINANSTKI
jgi:hypothetical protein